MQLRSCNGLTLIELLVVIAIMGILVGMIVPAVQMVREAARRTQCSNHLKQIGTALANFESAHRRLPPGITSSTAKPYRYMTWLTHLLPYIEQQNVWDQALLDYSYDPNPHVTHPGGAHFLFGDGSTRFLSYTSNDVLPALGTRAGGEVVAEYE